MSSRRILVVQEGWNRKATFNYIDTLPTIEKEGSSIGTLWFGPKQPVIAGRGQATRSMSRFSVGNPPVFADVEDASSIYNLVLGLREKLTRKDSAFVR